MRIDTQRFLKTKAMIDLAPTEKQIYQIDRLFKFMADDNEKTFKRQAATKRLPKMIKAGVDNAYIERFKRVIKYVPQGITLYKNCILYNKEMGLEYWNSYVEFQSKKNTFEYKNKKYGMSEYEFKDFNKSRSITLENMIKKYGSDEGTNRYNSYVEKQRYAGVALDYFISKHGEIKGTLEYNRVNKLKSNSYEALLSRLGSSEKVERWINRRGVKYAFYSEKSQKFIRELVNNINISVHDKVYYATNTRGEYGMICQEHKRYFRYDFVDHDNKICIEFHGDHYHANPALYEADDILYARGVVGYIASDVWKTDAIKKRVAVNRGFRFIEVWEMDWDKNPNKTIRGIIDEYYQDRKICN